MIAQGIVVRNGKFLMVKQNKHGKIFWNFPGGHVEVGETPEQACIREFLEEIGLRVAVIQSIGLVNKKHLFLVGIVSGDMKLEDGLLDIGWVADTEQDKWDAKTLQMLAHYRQFMRVEGDEEVGSCETDFDQKI
ncbi:NUDIX hydrolase [Paenibacillus allorhizosphaerae]|uniref:RNA pyrophosphohydrolase n=1 Tax=Paenibacillus allorhizosphaerae TaxID=2849866 RepID=A0ABM8VDE5_9BACL|nr:NUDIX hydrolase [Paenibacillus allorhizosphaerae]CAG7627309.1 RNA pyrophosphohydrolase [Paenibacillus allorhizosphaerae]